MILSTRLLFAGVAFAALAPGAAAFAQDAASSQPSAQKVQEVIVTAQKREQRLQDVAGSITAVGAQQLREEGITNIQSLTSVVSGLDFGVTNGGAFVTLRGVGLAVDTGVAEPNVAIHVDGVFLPRTTEETLDAVDLQRVEVLRGPQGTLYGRNATGGAINFISTPPSRQFGGEADLMVGDYDTVEVKAAVTGPINDMARFRFSAGYYDRGEGYVQDLGAHTTFDKDEKAFARAALNVDLTPKLNADLSLSYQSDQFQTYQSLVHPPGPFGPFIFPPLATAISPYAPWTTGGDYAPDSRRSTLIARVGLNWSITPDITLKSITGYIDHTFFNRLDGDGTSAPYILINNRRQPSSAVSQEFDLGGSLPNRGSWLVGAYAFYEDFTSSIPVVLPSGIPADMLPPGTTLLSASRELTQSYAAFADVTVGVTPKLRVYAGGRLSDDEKHFEQSAGAIIPGVPEAFTLTCDGLVLSHTYKSFSPRIGLQYDFTPQVMGYAQYSVGYKSGGLNSSTCGNIYAPERLQSSEIGLKTTLLDGRLTFNTALYYYDYSNLQLFEYVGLNAVIKNADARTYGADIDAKLKLTRHWRMDASATLLDAEFTKFSSEDLANPAAGVQNLNGQEIPRAPKYAVNAGLEGGYPVQLGWFSRFSVRAEAKWSGRFYFQAFNTPGYAQDDYVLGNLYATLATENGDTSVRAFVKNVGNTAVLGHAFYNSIQDDYLGNYLPPRTYGVELSKRF